MSYPESSGFLVSRRCQERLWDNGIVTAGILQLTVLSFVTVNSPEQPIKRNHIFFHYSPLTKKPEDSGYEIGL